MEDRKMRCSRRKFLAQAAALTLTGGVAASQQTREETSATFRTRPGKLTTTGRKPLAIVTTVYRPMSHAYHIAGRFLHGYVRDGQFHVPGSFVSSVYVD